MMNSQTNKDIIDKFRQDFVYSLHLLCGFLDESEIRSIFEHALESEHSN